MPSRSWWARIAVNSTCIATGSSDRFRMPRTYSRRLSCPHGRPSAASTGAPSGRGSTALPRTVASTTSGTPHAGRPSPTWPIPNTFFAEAGSSDEAWWIEPYPDAFLDDVALGPEARFEARESIALSFVAGLQHLPTQQRAALVLRDVLGFSASEVAEMLESTPASVNSALQRARAGFRPLRDADRIPLPNSQRESEVVDRFIDAFLRGRPPRRRRHLSEDAKLKMPPEPFEFQRIGRDRRVSSPCRLLG